MSEREGLEKDVLAKVVGSRIKEIDYSGLEPGWFLRQLESLKDAFTCDCEASKMLAILMQINDNVKAKPNT